MYLTILVWLGLLGLGLPLGQALQWGGDEGIELNKAAYWGTHGHWPTTAWNDQPLTQTRWYAWLLAGSSAPWAPRLYSLACGALLLAAVGWLTFGLWIASATRAATDDGTHRFLAARAAWAAVVSVALCPTFSELSLSAMQEIPATAWGLTAIACVVASFRRRRFDTFFAVWVSALFAAGAIAIKLTAGLYAAVAWALLVGGRRSHRSLAMETTVDARHGKEICSERTSLCWVALWTGWVIAGVVVSLEVLDGRGFAVLLGSHLRAFSGSAAAEASAGPDRWHQMLREYPEFLAWLTVGALGWWDEFRGRLRDGWRWFVLPGLALTWNALIQPWWPYYALSLWLGLAPFAGRGVVWVFDHARAHLRGVPRTSLSRSATAALGALVLAASASAVWNWGREYVTWRQHPRAAESPIVRTLQRYAPASAHGLTFSADPIYPFWCGLPTPASLLVVTRKRFLSGDVDQAEILRQVRESSCDFLIFVQDAGPSVREVWGDFVREHYVLAMVSEGRELYVHRRLHPEPFIRTLHW